MEQHERTAGATEAGELRRATRQTATRDQPGAREDAPAAAKPVAKPAAKVVGGSARTGAVPVVQARLGGDGGTDAERARHALCLPVLSEIAPRPGSGAWV